MWELRNVYVARYDGGPIVFIGENAEECRSYRPTEGGAVEEWICAVRFQGLAPAEVRPLAKSDPFDDYFMEGAITRLTPSPQR